MSEASSLFALPSFILGSSRYVSMRVHGAAAQVSIPTPDLPAKRSVVEYERNGIHVKSNYATEFAIHVPIPTPLIVDRSNIFSAVAHVFSGSRPDPVFEGTSLRVVRIGVYVHAQPARLDSLVATDGDRKLAEFPFQPMLIPNDPYLETRAPAYNWEVNQRVFTALAVSLTGRFEEYGEMGVNHLHLVAVKAVFAEAGT